MQTGKVFLLIGFSLFTLMVVVQQMVFMQFHEFRSHAGTNTDMDTLNLVFKGVNLIQLGIDVAFDIFYCLGIIFLSVAMFRHTDFGRVIGAFGVISATALLLMNLAAFPYVPDESGLIDLGPLTGIWWLLVIGQMVRLRIRERRKDTSPVSL